MEKVKKPKSIKRAFIWGVTITMLIVFVSSALTIYGCYRIQKYILPNSQEIWLHTQTVMADGTISEAKQRFTFDEPSQISFITPSNGSETKALDDTEFTIEKIESNFSTLSPKRQVVYRAMSVSMVALPLIYSVVGIGLCAWWFYRKKSLLIPRRTTARFPILSFDIPASISKKWTAILQVFPFLRKLPAACPVKIPCCCIPTVPLFLPLWQERSGR